MNKQEFLSRLREGISALPEDDVNERLAFYSEMIDDRIEEGLSEDQAVAEIGDAEKVIAQILSDTPFTKIVKEKIKTNKSLKPFEIVLIILGAPIWIPLLIAVIAVSISVYAAIWSVIIALWAASASLAGAAIGGILSGVFLAFSGKVTSGIFLIGGGICSAGFFIFSVLGCKYSTKGILHLTGKIPLIIKKLFSKREAAE